MNNLQFELKNDEYKYKNIRIVEFNDGTRAVERIDGKAVYKAEIEKLPYKIKCKRKHVYLRRMRDYRQYV